MDITRENYLNSKMKHYLYIHIGIQKTGTTAIQYFLYSNREYLQQLGFSYPVFEEERKLYPAFKSPDYMKNGDYLISEDLRIYDTSSNFEAACDHIIQELKSRNVIISEEGYVGYNINLLDQLLSNLVKKIENIRIVVYLRRQDLLAESLWNQKIKGGSTAKRFKEYIKTDVPEWFDYRVLFGILNKYINDENIIVRVYEKQQFYGGNIEDDFLDAVAIHTNTESWKRGGVINRSLKGNYLEIKRIINSVNQIEYFPSFFWRDKMVELSELYANNKDMRNCFEIAERNTFLKRYEESNRYIAHKFFGREQLFLESTIDNHTNETLMTDESDLLFDTIRLFGLLLGNLQNQIFSLKNQLYDQITREIFRMSDGREIYFWGAGNNCKKILGKWNGKVYGIIDSDKSKEGTKIYNSIIVSPEHVDGWENIFIVITPFDSKEIVDALNSYGLSKDKDYCLAIEIGLIDE